MANQRSPPYVDFQVGSGTTDASGDATVSFPRGFSRVPKVFLQGVDAGAKGIVLDVVSKSHTGCTVKARKVTGITSGAPSATASPVNTIDDHTTGTPSATVSVASSGHTHSFTPSGTVSSFTGNTAGATGTVDPGVGGTAYTHSYEAGSDSHHHTNPSTGYGGVNHTHGFSGTTGGPSATVSPVNTIDDHTTGGPSTPHTTVATSYHTHTAFTTGAPVSATVNQAVALTGGDGTYAGLYGVPSAAVGNRTCTTGGPIGTITVASSLHTHTVSTHTGSRVGAASSTHTHGYSGTTGGASAYSHQHTVGNTGDSTTGLVLLVNYHYHVMDHGHTFTGSGGTTGTPSTPHTSVASSTHTHTVSTHTGSRIDVASSTHTHLVDSPVTGVSFDWLAIL